MKLKQGCQIRHSVHTNIESMSGSLRQGTQEPRTCSNFKRVIGNIRDWFKFKNVNKAWEISPGNNGPNMRGKLDGCLDQSIATREHRLDMQYYTIERKP